MNNSISVTKESFNSSFFSQGMAEEQQVLALAELAGLNAELAYLRDNPLSGMGEVYEATLR